MELPETRIQTVTKGKTSEVGPSLKEIRDAESAAREFEAMFLSQAVDEMLKSVDSGAFSGGQAAEMWRSFMAQAVADQIAGQSRTGIAQSIQASISAYSTGRSQPEEDPA
ncbi:rod-binding protein [Pseudooceanicola nanhaiensis]|uniref:rod-binding protein n=1 Tax=Pseudooceanicola nanhaiensis TaxID=375761 RepID=UPI001CD30654|nr:rod-binding protein [Pseudooceanicola nanhaiensis]MCA0922625.1 rod-binding protein [Pseudooceanicola nanhaiensis]